MAIKDAEKNAAYMKEYAAKNKEALAAYNKEYRARNKEALKLKDAAKYLKNKEHRNAQAREYHAKNAETIAVKRKVYYENNKETLAAKKKIYQSNNMEAHKARMARYNQTLKGKITRNVKDAKRNAAKLNRTPTWLSELDKWMIDEIYMLSALRTELTGVDWHVDHIYPLQGKIVSGLHVPSNLRVITAKENRIKGNRLEA